MALDYTRITTAAKADVISQGLKPDDVDYVSMGLSKSPLEIIIDAVAKAVVNEFITNAQVTTTVATVVTGTLPTGPVAAAGTGSGTGNIL